MEQREEIDSRRNDEWNMPITRPLTPLSLRRSTLEGMMSGTWCHSPVGARVTTEEIDSRRNDEWNKASSRLVLMRSSRGDRL